VHAYIGEALDRIKALCERSEKQAFLTGEPKDPARIRRLAEAECEHLVEEYVIISNKGYELIEGPTLPKEDVLEIINIVRICWKNINVIEDNFRKINITLNKVVIPLSDTSHKPYNPYERSDLP
jgi:hypothetical protein